MTRQENAVNESLCALDEAHRLGRITRDEYRARRRYVIGRLSDSNGETARNAITQQGSVADVRGRGDDHGKSATDADAMRAMFPSRVPMVLKIVAGLVVLAALVALGMYVLLGRS